MTILTLASASTIRADLLRRAEVAIVVHPVNIDEAALRESLSVDGAATHDIAAALAEQKAARAAKGDPAALVLGCDQILDCDGTLLAKPENQAQAHEQLRFLRAKTHQLYTAGVLYQRAKAVWRHVSVSCLTMRDFSDVFLDDYVNRHWNDIRHCVGCYQIEGPGVRLFSHIEGDFFAIQGLPLLELLAFLNYRKDILE